MKLATKAYFVGTIMIAGTGAQTPPLKQGVSVEMAVGSHAVEMRAADNQKALVVAITEDGRVYVGIEPSEPAALNRLSARIVYVKADARAPYQSLGFWTPYMANRWFCSVRLKKPRSSADT